jgi:hypothetical protein
MNWDELNKRAEEFKEISAEMDQRLIKLAQVTWDVIGEDVLGIEGLCTSIPRKEVIEIVGDADYMYLHGSDPEAYAYFIFLRKHNLKHRDKIMKLAFPNKRYGW